LRKRAEREGKEDGGGFGTAEVADGPSFAEGVVTMIPTNPKMPVGARMMVADEVYELRADHKLWHVPVKVP
jgi:hypothetical protein